MSQLAVGGPSVPCASNRKCRGEALLYDAAAGLEASGLSAQVISSFAWQGVRRHATVVPRRVEASVIHGPDVALVAISRLLRVRDSLQSPSGPARTVPMRSCDRRCLRRAVPLRSGRRLVHDDQKRRGESEPQIPFHKPTFFISLWSQID